MISIKFLCIVTSAVISASMISPLAVSFADTSANTGNSEVVSTNLIGTKIGMSSLSDAPDNQTLSMQNFFVNAGITDEQSASLIQEIGYLNHHTKQERSRYYYLTQKLSAKQVRKAWNSASFVSTATSFFTSMAGKYAIYPAMAAVALYGTYYTQLYTAQKHNWGIKITLRTDSYNPTSTGMRWTVSYIK